MASADGERAALAAALKRAARDRFAPACLSRSTSAVAPVEAAARGGISFSAPLLRTVLSGQKTQTRRPIRPVPADVCDGVPRLSTGEPIEPLARVGDRLWVRESWARLPDGRFAYAADGASMPGSRWISSRFMPRAAARTFLRVDAVDVALLSAIDEADALAEGAAADATSTMFGSRPWFFTLWDSIYGQTEFAVANDPWVWVVRFTREGGPSAA